MGRPRPYTATCERCHQTRTLRYPATGPFCHACTGSVLATIRNAQESDIDEVAVDRLVAGDRPAHTTRAERQAAVEVLSRRGWPVSRIAEYVGITPRSVGRLRARAGLTEPRSWQRQAVAA